MGSDVVLCGSVGAGNTTKLANQIMPFIKECDVKHISAYILNIEENTPFFKMQNKLNLPDEDSVCEFYKFTSKINNFHIVFY